MSKMAMKRRWTTPEGRALATRTEEERVPLVALEERLIACVSAGGARRSMASETGKSWTTFGYGSNADPSWRSRGLYCGHRTPAWAVRDQAIRGRGRPAPRFE